MRIIEAIYLLLLVCLLGSAITLHIQSGRILADPTSIKLDWKETWGGEYRDYSYSATFIRDGLYVTGASYVEGTAKLKLILLRYEENGTLAWSQTYWRDGYAMGRGIVSGSDNVYVSAIHISDEASYSLLLKYDLNGNIIWEREWNPGPNAKASGIALDSAENVYVTGYVQETPTENRVFLLKYDPRGDLSYAMVYPGNGTETAWGLTVRDAVYICGESTVDPAAAEETGVPQASTLLMKIGADGELIWRRKTRVGLDNVANSVYAKDGVTVAGYTSYANGTSKIIILRYLCDGELASTRILGDALIEDMAWGIAEAGDYAYVVGHTRTIFSDLADASILKLGADDSVLLEHRYVDYSIDRARAVVVNGDDVYVVGETYWRNLDMQVLVIKYISPNASLSPRVSQALRISPLVIGTILIILQIIETLNAIRHKS